MLLEQNGEASSAAAYFRRAIELAPRYASAYYQLARLKDAKLSKQETDTIGSLFRDPQTTDEQKAPLAFALACTHERDKDYEGAFRYLEIGQAIKAKTHPYDDRKVIEYHENIKRVFSMAVTPPDESLACGAQTPVFVLGMPRSGTTLIEQILASHSAIEGAGELGFMESTINEAARIAREKFPDSFAMLSTDEFSVDRIHCGDSAKRTFRTLPSQSAG